MIYVMSFLHLQNVKNLITFFINYIKLIMIRTIVMKHHSLVMMAIFLIRVEVHMVNLK